MPQQSYGGQYLHRDVFEMAAAYAYDIAESRRSSTGTTRQLDKKRLADLFRGLARPAPVP